MESKEIANVSTDAPAPPPDAPAPPTDAPATPPVDQKQGEASDAPVPTLPGHSNSVNVEDDADAEDEEASSTVANKGSDDEENDDETVKEGKSGKRKKVTQVGAQPKKGNNELSDLRVGPVAIEKGPVKNPGEGNQGFDAVDVLSEKVKTCLDRVVHATTSFGVMDDMFDGLGIIVSSGVIICAQPEDTSRFSATTETYLHSQDVFVRARNADELDELSVGKLFDVVRTARKPGVVLIRNGELANKDVADAIVKNAAVNADCHLPIITVVTTINLDMVDRSLFDAFSVRPLD